MKKKGFTLIELMAAIAIGAIIIITVGKFFVNYSGINTNIQDNAINQNYYNIAKSQIINLGYRKQLEKLGTKEVTNNLGEEIKIIIAVKDSSEIDFLGKNENNGNYYIYKNVNIENNMINNAEKIKLENISNIQIESNANKVNNNLSEVNLTVSNNKAVKTYEFSLITYQ